MDPTIIVMLCSSLFTNLALCFGKIKRCRGCGNGCELEMMGLEKIPTKTSKTTKENNNPDSII